MVSFGFLPRSERCTSEMSSQDSLDQQYLEGMEKFSKDPRFRRRVMFWRAVFHFDDPPYRSLPLRNIKDEADAQHLAVQQLKRLGMYIFPPDNH